MVVSPSGFYPYVSRVGGMAQRFITDEVSHSGKVMTLRLKPLLPAITAGSALIYNQGQESTKQNGESTAWLRVLAEAGLAYLVLDNTAGIYPLFGLGLAAYRAGQQSNALDQMKAVINTGVTLFLGSVGVTFFKGMANVAAQMEDQAIFRALHDQTPTGASARRTHIGDWMGHLQREAGFPGWDEQSQRTFQSLHTHLNELKAKLGQLYPDWLPTAARGPVLSPNSPEYQQLEHEVLAVKERAVHQAGLLQDDAFRHVSADTKNAATRLLSHIGRSESSWTRLVRAANPVFGYIIVGFILGTPLANWISSWFGNRRPQLQQKQFNQQGSFQPEHRAWPAASGGHGASHGGRAMHGSSYGQPYYTTTAVTWPGMNSNQPAYVGDVQRPDPNAPGSHPGH